MTEKLDCVAAYDSGGTRTRVAIAGLDGEIIGKVEKNTEGVSGKDLPRIIGDCIDELTTDKKNVRIVAIGSSQAGIIDYDNGVILLSVNVKDGKDIQMKSELEKKFGVPFYLENDGNAGAYGVLKKDTQAQGMENLVYVVMGKGIGGGIISKSEIQGGDGSAGEFGHDITVVPNGRDCSYGENGCWESYCSGGGIKRSVDEELAKSIRRLLNLDNETEIKAEHVFEAYREGCTLSKDIIEKVGEYNAIAVATIIKEHKPEAVFIGESVAKNREILDMLKEQVPALLPDDLKETKIFRTELDDPCLYGAIQIAIDGHRKQEKS